MFDARPDPDVDVLVIGAGPAGAAAAWCAAKSGSRRVLLVERCDWPRSKVCGSCVNPAGVDVLTRMGVYPSATLPTSTLTRLRLHAGAPAIDLNLNAGLAIERAALDAALVDAARAVGASFQPRTSASVLAREGGTQRPGALEEEWGAWRIRLPAAELTARVVIACDGLTGTSLSAISERERLGVHIEPSSWMGAGTVIPADRAECWHDAVAEHEVAMHIADHAYVGLVRLADGRVDLAAALDASRAKAAGGPAGAIADVLSTSGFDNAHARLAPESIHGVGLLTRRRPISAVPGLIIAGDAAGYVEPFTGEGITWALVQGERAGVLAARAARDAALWRSLPAEWSRWLAATIAPRRIACRALRWTLRRPVARRTVAAALANSAVARTGAASFVRRMWRPYPHRPQPVGDPRVRTVISGIATATPPGEATQEQALNLLVRAANLQGDKLRFARAIYERSGIDRRASVLCDTSGEQSFYVGGAPTTAARMALYAGCAPALAAGAAAAALRRAGVAASEITHLVTASCTGFTAPGVDVELVERLGLPPDVRRTHVGFMGCHAAINALALAASIARSARRDSDKPPCILVACVELSSIHLQPSDRPDHIVASALFGDGAAACVVRAEGDNARPRQPDGPALELVDTGSAIIPGTRDAMAWHIGNHGFAMTLADSVPAIVREHLRPWLTRWLAGTPSADVDDAAWCIHPGGPRILEAVRDALDLDPGALSSSREILRARGNMSSATILFILERMLEDRTLAPGRPVVMLAFGPGLSIEAALARAR